MKMSVMPDSPVEISIIIPVYNNAPTLTVLLERLKYMLVNEPFKSKTKEIILVNDGSTDNSAEVIRSFWKNHSTSVIIKHIVLSRNFGQLSAILCGINVAKGSCVATLSADLQDPPELIIEMYKGWQENVFVNLGYRKNRADGWANRFFSMVFYTIVKQYHDNLPAGGYDYVLLDRKIIDHLLEIRYKNRFLQGDILSLGYTVRWYPYSRASPATKENKVFKAFKINYFIDSIFHTKFLINVLFMVSAIIILAGLITIVNHFIVPENNTLNIGLIVLLLGIVNTSFTVVIAYCWRIYNDMKIFPDFIIKAKEEY